MTAVSMRELLEAGVHFGHQTRRWNPKMRRFIFGERGGIYIIDLQQTSVLIDEAHAFVRKIAERGGTVLFVGTKKQCQDTIQSRPRASTCRTSTTAGSAACSPTSARCRERIERLHELRRLRDGRPARPAARRRSASCSCASSRSSRRTSAAWRT